MSREQEELRRLARHERQVAWASAKRIPGRAGDAAGAFARQHPTWAMGGAAFLAMSLMARKSRGSGGEKGHAGSWSMALSALGVQFLPGLLKLVGLTIPDVPAPDETSGDAPAASRPGMRDESPATAPT